MDFFSYSFVFLLWHSLQSEATGNEPVCSKFLYEEQLLGKMTRVEVQMEEWDKHLKKFEETVLSVLEHRREEIEKMTKEFKTIKGISEEYGQLKDAQNKKLEEVSTEQSKIRDVIRNKTLEEIGKIRDAQNKKLEHMSLEQRKLWDVITNMTLERQNTDIVAFNAYSTTIGIYPENKILKFDKVLLNEGDGYDATSGYFSAPFTGLYQFTAHACNDAKHYVVYAIVHESTTVALSSIYGGALHTCASVGGIVEMQAGERVSVKSAYSSSYLFSNQHRRPSFMGVLLQRNV